MLGRDLAITTVALLVLLPSPGCGKTTEKPDNAAPAEVTKTDQPATTPAKPAPAPAAAPSGEDAIIEQWVAMWTAVGKAAAGGDCDKAAAALTEIFKKNRPAFQGITKLAMARGEDELTKKFAARIKAPMAQFTDLTKKCAQNANMMEALHTMNQMYGSE